MQPNWRVVTNGSVPHPEAFERAVFAAGERYTLDGAFAGGSALTM
jgi:hypothetical protein